jgi:hypothetical protein
MWGISSDNVFGDIPRTKDDNKKRIQDAVSSNVSAAYRYALNHSFVKCDACLRAEDCVAYFAPQVRPEVSRKLSGLKTSGTNRRVTRGHNTVERISH